MKTAKPLFSSWENQWFPPLNQSIDPLLADPRTSHASHARHASHATERLTQAKPTRASQLFQAEASALGA